MKHLRAALHVAVDLVLDAIEKDRGAREDEPTVHVPAPVAKRASRRGAGLRAWTPVPVDAVSARRAEEICKRKGIA